MLRILQAARDRVMPTVVDRWALLGQPHDFAGTFCSSAGGRRREGVHHGRQEMPGAVGLGRNCGVASAGRSPARPPRRAERRQFAVMIAAAVVDRRRPHFPVTISDLFSSPRSIVLDERSSPRDRPGPQVDPAIRGAVAVGVVVQPQSDTIEAASRLAQPAGSICRPSWFDAACRTRVRSSIPEQAAVS